MNANISNILSNNPNISSEIAILSLLSDGATCDANKRSKYRQIFGILEEKYGVTTLAGVMPTFQAMDFWPKKTLKSGDVSPMGVNAAAKINEHVADFKTFYESAKKFYATMAERAEMERINGLSEDEKAKELAAKQAKDAEAATKKEAEALAERERIFNEEMEKRGLKLETMKVISTVEDAINCLVSFTGTPENAVKAIQEMFGLSTVETGKVIDITPEKVTDISPKQNARKQLGNSKAKKAVNA